MRATDEHRTGATKYLTEDLSSLGGKVTSFDVVVIGSGYGAAMATYHLSLCLKDGRPLQICVLERGKEYLDGSFPKDATELPGHVRTSTANSKQASGNLDALFDVRANGDVSSLIANGFGGGSLINAGVMIEPLPSVFAQGWPLAFSDLPFAECKSLLQARQLDEAQLPQKYQELKALAPCTRPAEITVFEGCNSCGNCATGCNFGHKASLDRTLFGRAKENNPDIKFLTGATVDQIKQVNGGWETHIIPTRKDVRLRTSETIIACSSQVILAAGTFGSTEILMKSRTEDLKVSDQLGKHFSSNGDMLAVGFQRNRKVNAISRTPTAGGASVDDVGPTITGVADYRESDGILLQEMNVPFPIASFFDEIFSTSAAITAATKFDLTKHAPEDQNDPFSLNPKALGSTSVYAMMSEDDATGEIIQTLSQAEIKSAYKIGSQLENHLENKNKSTADLMGDGLVTVKWPTLKKSDIFNKQITFLEQLSKSVGGTVIANPLWRPLPKALDFLAGDMEGPLLTVHPLGGCAMAKRASDGVVNERGEVFNCDRENSVHKGLVVLDGSIIPRSLGANPALTISAVALNAIRQLAHEWDYLPHLPQPQALPERKTYRQIEAVQVEETRIQVVERMTGAVSLPATGKTFVLELTMSSSPTSLRAMSASSDRRIEIKEESFLRFYNPDDYESLLLNKASFLRLEDEMDRVAVAKFNLRGSLTLFPRASSTLFSRLWQGAQAYALNRGLRDVWQAAFDKKSGGGSVASSMFAVLAHAGEIRTMDYDLQLIKCMKAPPVDSGLTLGVGDAVKGKKTITYKRAANPLRQMSEMTVDKLGNVELPTQKPVLALQPEFLAREGVPLLRVVGQSDSVTAVLDFMALAGYIARMLFTIHSFTFRLPDTYRQPPLSRLPGRIPGVPNFEQIELQLDDAHALLTRYEVKNGQPVLLMHGYSASGTTFAHESIPEPFARYLVQQGYDVWLLDARTSPGLPSAQRPWAFEDVGEKDIPAAIQHVSQATGHKVNIVAHCMGAGMFSMAVLSDKNDVDKLINRAVMTQVGPGVVVSPGNVFRSYMLRYLKQFFSLKRFDFRVDNTASLADQLIDRLLNILPYSDEEFKLENPAWPPWKRTEWVGIRHRMDMLWGETFKLNNVEAETLENIDALFGTLNLETLSQVIPLSKWMNITNKQGKNEYFQHERLKKYWCFDTLSLSTRENGLWSAATLNRNRRFFSKGINCTYSTKLLTDFGHQDIWLSKTSSEKIYPLIHDFLSGDTSQFDGSVSGSAKPSPYIRAPYLGPVISHDWHEDGRQNTILKFSKRPNVGLPFLALVLEVDEVSAGHYQSSTSLVGEDWIKDIAQARVFGTEAPMYLMKQVLAPDKQYLLLLVSVENPDLGMSTMDIVGRSFADTVIEDTTKGVPVGSDKLLDNGMDGEMEVFASGLLRKEFDSIKTILPAAGEEIGKTLSNKARRIRRGLFSVRPIQARDALSMVIGSCQYNAGLIDDYVAYQSYRTLSKELEINETPLDLMLLLGDQIYVDATAGLFDPLDHVQAYQAPYEKWLSNRSVRKVMRKLPNYKMLDDHEIIDNWEPGHPLEKLKQGLTAFKAFQFGAENGRDLSKFWGPIEASPLPIFMLNTRTDRSERSRGASDNASMIGDKQLAGLIRWVDQLPEGKPCVISSSSLLLPRHYPLDHETTATFMLDSIDGYPKTFRALLQMVVDRPERIFVFVSGDEHIPLIAKITFHDAQGIFITKTHSIHTGALYAPYPFANGQKEQLIENDEFPVMTSAGQTYVCSVTVEHLDPTPGFTRLDLSRDHAGQWQLQGRVLNEKLCRFDLQL